MLCYAMLYPQNGDRIVAIDSVTSLHLLYCKVVQIFILPDFTQCQGPGAYCDNFSFSRKLSNATLTKQELKREKKTNIDRL